MIGAFLERIAIRDWRKLTGVFFVSTVLESLALGHITAFTPLFLRDDLQMAPEEIAIWTGILMSATFAIAFPLAPLWGALAERYSRKLIIVRAQYIEGVVFIMCGLAPDLWWFLGARLLLGLTFGNIAVLIAVQAILTPERRVATGISVVQAANPIALSFGPPLGALLIPFIGVRGLFVFDGIACLVSAVMITLLMPEPPGRDRSRAVMANVRGTLTMAVREPALRWNFAGWFLTRGGMGVLDTYLPVRITELQPTNAAAAIGLIMGVHGLLTTVFTAITGRFVDRWGAARMFWPGMLVATVCSVGVAFAPGIWLVAAFNWVRAIPVALTGTVLYAHLAQVSRGSVRSQMLSLTPAPRNMSNFALPLLCAAVAGFGTWAALLVAAVSYGLATWVGWLMLQAPPIREEGQKEREVPDLAPPERVQR